MKTRFDFTDTSQPIEDRFTNLTSEVNGRAQILDYLLKNIAGYMQQLEAEVDGNPAAENYLEQCQTEVGKASTVVSEVAKIKRMDLQESELFDLKHALTEVKERVEKISDYKIFLNLGDREECLMKGSKEQLVEAFMFLAANIELGEITVNLDLIDLEEGSVSLRHASLPKGNYWTVTLSASAVNVNDFSPVMYSKSTSFKNKLFLREGTLCLGTVIRHNGDLLALDDKDQSLSLAVLLPAVETGAVQGALDQSLENESFHGNETILVVDDEDMIWEILIENLQELGYTVILAEHGLDAVQIYKENPGFIDVVILDMVMPKMNGREAFVELKKLDENINVILSSGYMAEGEAGDLLESGAKCFLRKPYKMIDLARKIREILD